MSQALGLRDGQVAPTATGFALFGTAIGECALVWRDGRVIATQLPESSRAASRVRMLRRFPGVAEGEMPLAIAAVATAVAAHLEGRPADLVSVPLATEHLPPFDAAVYAAARAIPSGETRTYGEIAQAIGAPGSARAVGAALGRNPFPPIVPCHRIVAAAGRTGGFSAPGGRKTKLKLLEIEGAGRRGTLFDERLISPLER